jgi:uncharacterized membrane protein YfcA
MRQLVLVALVGLAAQLVDGALGMAYGATTATLLLGMGLAPALVSTTTHLAEVGTTLVSGAAHSRFGNVDWRSVAWLGVPGGVGALAGAWTLTRLDASAVKPWTSGFLLTLGVYILLRFTLLNGARHRALGFHHRPTGRFLLPLGLLAGFLDAAGGGGWGPLATSTMLASRRLVPNKAVGTVNTSEFLVALCASIGFIAALGVRQVPWALVGALLAGGMVAAPVAALMVRRIPGRVLGTLVGGLILLLNLRTVLLTLNVHPQAPVFATAVLVWATLLALAVRGARADAAVRAPA